MADLSDRERYLARSALGLQYNDRKQSYRNGFVLQPQSRDFDVWCDMTKRGFAERSDGTKMSCFRLTRRGAEAALKPGESLDPEDFPTSPQSPPDPASPLSRGEEGR